MAEPLPSSITITRTEYPDSITIGRVSKGGELKIYLNVSDLAECQKRIDNMVSARQYLLQKLGGALD
ncbi:MAG: hypothetical protein PHT99_03540 [Methanoregula sp.]|nr:hypothetical protein [Methanoregula sp.]